VALHTVANLEAYLHMHALHGNVRAFEQDIQQAQDLAEMRRCHEDFVGACSLECTLSADGHLATVVMGMLDICLAVAHLSATELLHEVFLPNQKVHDCKATCNALVERVMSKEVWSRAQNINKGLKQRVKYLQSRLRFRAGRGLLETWHSAMSFTCCLWD
jgi:hypothetical protein